MHGCSNTHLEGSCSREQTLSTHAVLVKVQQVESMYSKANLLLRNGNVTKKYANEKTHRYVGLNSGGSHIGYITNSHFVLG